MASSPEPASAAPGAAPATADAGASTTSTIRLRIPSKYAAASSSSSHSDAVASPPLSFLHRTWSVTHSTLSMWRTARNVRITYSPLPGADDATTRTRVGDLVEYEPAGGKGGGVKTVSGVDTASSASSTLAWDWRGKGWLFFVTSHWEVLGWGERALADDGGTERWAVTWFAPTLFTAEGLDVYCDRPGGLSAETEALVLEALRGIGVSRLVEMVERDMRPVDISLPWKTK